MTLSIHFLVILVVALDFLIYILIYTMTQVGSGFVRVLFLPTFFWDHTRLLNSSNCLLIALVFSTEFCGIKNLASILNLLLISTIPESSLGLNLSILCCDWRQYIWEEIESYGFYNCCFSQAKSLKQGSEAGSGDNSKLLSNTAAIGAECLVDCEVWMGQQPAGQRGGVGGKGEWLWPRESFHPMSQRSAEEESPHLSILSGRRRNTEVLFFNRKPFY